jgi:hypothetical protein
MSDSGFRKALQSAAQAHDLPALRLLLAHALSDRQRGLALLLIAGQEVVVLGDVRRASCTLQRARQHLVDDYAALCRCKIMESVIVEVAAGV